MSCVSARSQLRQSEALRHKYTGLLFLADAGARCSNSAELSTEQLGSHAPKQQYDIRLLFKIKHSVLTPAYKSQKRYKRKLFCLSFVREHFVLFLQHIPITVVASDYVIIVGTSRSHNASCRPYCAVTESKPNWRGLPDGGQWSKTRLEL